MIVEGEMKSGTVLFINFTQLIISYVPKTCPTLLEGELEVEISPHQQTFTEYVHRIRLDSRYSLRDSFQMFKIKLRREMIKFRLILPRTITHA